MVLLEKNYKNPHEKEKAMEDRAGLRFFASWPEGAMDVYQQESSETMASFFQKMQRLASRHHESGSLQGVLVGFMTTGAWKKACRDSTKGGRFPKIMFAQKERGEGAPVRVEIRITGITVFGQVLRHFIP